MATTQKFCPKVRGAILERQTRRHLIKADCARRQAAIISLICCAPSKSVPCALKRVQPSKKGLPPPENEEQHSAAENHLRQRGRFLFSVLEGRLAWKQRFCGHELHCLHNCAVQVTGP
eukprot:scaffold22293_cov31-Tisochrysis_lutea.AAC.2